MTVNQRVASSSLAGGAQVDKPAEMSAFSFTGKGFGGCNFYDRLTNKSINRWLTKYMLFPAL